MVRGGIRGAMTTDRGGDGKVVDAVPLVCGTMRVSRCAVTDLLVHQRQVVMGIDVLRVDLEHLLQPCPCLEEQSRPLLVPCISPRQARLLEQCPAEEVEHADIAGKIEAALTRTPETGADDGLETFDGGIEAAILAANAAAAWRSSPFVEPLSPSRSRPMP